MFNPITELSKHLLLVVDHIDLLITELSSGHIGSQPNPKQESARFSDIPDLPSSDFHAEINDVLSGMMADSPGPKNPVEEISAFFSAVDFKVDGKWIYPLLACHLILFLLVVKMRKRVEILGIMFILLAIPLRLSSMINTYLSPIHGLFSSQNYFTKDGIFLSCFFSLPFLLICCLIVFFLVLEAGRMLIVVKRLGVGEKGKRMAKEARDRKGNKKKD